MRPWTRSESSSAAGGNDKVVIDKLSAEERERLLRIAFKEHFLRWMQGDSEDYHEIRHKGGVELKAPVLRRIAKRYHVNRGIRRLENDQDDLIGKKLAEILCSDAKKHKGLSICKRWEATRELAKKCQDEMENQLRDNEQTPNGEVAPIVSAVTKLTWFLAPDGWTMFDRFAREALGVRETGAENQAEAFYRQLCERRFCKHVADVKKVLVDRHFNGLFGERVIDKYLMLAGQMPAGRVGDSVRRRFLDEESCRVDRSISALCQVHAYLDPRFKDAVDSCAAKVAALATEGFLKSRNEKESRTDGTMASSILTNELPAKPRAE